jgi:hypothetical protein
MSACSRVGDYKLRPPLVGFQGVYAKEAGLVALIAVLPALAHALGTAGRLSAPTAPAAAVLPLMLIPIIAIPHHRGPARESR